MIVKCTIYEIEGNITEKDANSYLEALSTLNKYFDQEHYHFIKQFSEGQKTFHHHYQIYFKNASHLELMIESYEKDIFSITLQNKLFLTADDINPDYFNESTVKADLSVLQAVIEHFYNNEIEKVKALISKNKQNSSLLPGSISENVNEIYELHEDIQVLQESISYLPYLVFDRSIKIFVFLLSGFGFLLFLSVLESTFQIEQLSNLVILAFTLILLISHFTNLKLGPDHFTRFITRKIFHVKKETFHLQDISLLSLKQKLVSLHEKEKVLEKRNRIIAATIQILIYTPMLISGFNDTLSMWFFLGAGGFASMLLISLQDFVRNMLNNRKKKRSFM